MIDYIEKLVDVTNIASLLDDETLNKISEAVSDGYDIDKQSREGWEKTNEEAIKLAKQVWEQKNSPFTNAANVKYPLLATASIQFAARAYPNFVKAPDVVKGLVIGSDNIIKSKVIKYEDREKADKVYNYPYPAIEEALANAVYHRNYELRDPIEVRVLPSSIEIISYSGIDPSLTQSDFEKGVVRTRRYRNRRIGSFLKELGLTEGKGTGIPIMYKVLKDNGSPNPIFDTDYPNRSFFVVEFPIYPGFKDYENNGGSMGGSIGSSINLTDRQNEIIGIIKSDNKMSYRAIAEKLKINDSAVKKHLNALKRKGVLKRVGGTRGHWQVKA